VTRVYIERMTSDQTYLTITEAADRLEVSSGTVRRWVREGRLPAITHPSGRRRIRPEDIDAILATAESGTAA
jgi:excisionase family DNA binding protein